MKTGIFKKTCALMISFVIICASFVWADSSEVLAATCPSCSGSGKAFCPVCAGIGTRSQTIYRQIYIGPGQSIVHPQTYWFPCGTCGGSGRMFCPTCSGTGRTNGSGSAGSAQSLPKVKYGTVLAATDGIGNYEDAPNLLDGRTDTKFNVKATKAFVIWKAPKMLRVRSYTITTANDTATYKGRNPKTWVLYGSNKKLSRNAKGWKKIHSVKNDKKLKAVNFKSFTYKLKKTAKPYRYYKLEIKANKGCDCTQLSEFRLKGKAVTVKKPELSLAKKSGSKLRLKWKTSRGASGYLVQYSTSAKFKNCKKVEVKGAAKRSKTIANLNSKNGYYVRIRAYKKVNGGIVYSAWSKKKKAA